MINKGRLLASPGVPGQTAPERAVAEIIVSALKLDLHPSGIWPETRLIGGGLGLKAIDILDVALRICRTYGFEAGLDDVSYHEIFASLRSLAAYVEAHGTRRRITRGVKHLAQSVAFFGCGSATLH